MLESLFKPLLYLVRYPRELRLREECRFIGSEAVARDPAASDKLLQIARSTQSLNDTKQSWIWMTQKQNFCIAGSPSNLYFENIIRRQK
jgi:hypothetical protein